MALGFSLFFALGLAFGTWRYLAGLTAVVAGAGLLLWVNDGLYGYGWGDFGIEFSVLFAGAILFGAGFGAAARHSVHKDEAQQR